MSILIKGIDMPEDYVDIRVFADGTVKSYKHNGLDVKTQKNAVVEVQTPHGRLIDADAMKKLWKGCTIKGSIDVLLDARPTVIEAEVEE